MSQRITLLVGAVMLAWVGAATATLERIEEAFELGLEQVRLPRHEAGRLLIRQCAHCKRLALAVTERTVYRLGPTGESVTLHELHEAAAAAEDAAVYVFYSTDSGTVNRVVLSVRRWASPPQRRER